MPAAAVAFRLSGLRPAVSAALKVRDFIMGHVPVSLCPKLSRCEIIN